MNRLLPRDLIVVTPAASVQFTQPFQVRVIRVNVYGSTPAGWIWVTGYQLDDTGKAIGEEPRELFVQVAGLRLLHRPPVAGARQRLTARAAAGVKAA